MHTRPLHQKVFIIAMVLAGAFTFLPLLARAATTPTITAAPASVAPGDTITVTVANGPGNLKDWVGIYPVSQANGCCSIIFQYLNGSKTPPKSPLTSATLIFTAPTTPGNYNFRFEANDVYTLLATSQTVTVTGSSDTTPPSAPTGLTATAISSSQINLTWTASTDNVGVTGYKIFRGGTQVGTSATNSYSDTGLTASTLYSYTVSAYDAAGNNSAQSTSANATTQASSDTTPPSVPTSLSATAVSSSQINLTWSASTDNVGVTGYKVYRNGTQVGTSATASYSDTGLTASTLYSYTVSAYDAAGNNSAQSTSANATTQAGGSGVLPISSGGTGTTSLPAAMDSLTSASRSVTGAIVRLQRGLYGLAPSICSLFSDATTCAKLVGYADPRQFGAYCDSLYNSNYHDDAPGITAALATGVPVMIPYPGCKIASQVMFSGNGQTLLSFGGSGPYSAQQAVSKPYIYVTDNLAGSGSTNNCAIDTKGYDGVTLRHITMLANYRNMGTVAVCNSVGIQGGLAAAFLNIDGVTISNFGTGIGAAMTSLGTCVPTGTLNVPVFQIRGSGLNVSNSCTGMYRNFSDLHLSDMFFSSLAGECLSTNEQSGAQIDISNMRCEYAGHNDYGALKHDGSGIYLNGWSSVHRNCPDRC